MRNNGKGINATALCTINITTRIKQLEEELGAPLFYREGKALKLTPSGEIFLDYCHKILALCDEAKRSIHPDAPPSGPLKWSY